MSMTDSASDEGIAYSYRPSLVGAPWEFRLADDAIEWTTGRRSGRTLYRNVRRVRLSFKPGTMQTQSYRTEIWSEGQPRLLIVSTSWVSMVVQERLDKPYAAFVAELHRRLARANAGVRYERGTAPLQYWFGLVLYVGLMLGFALLAVRGLQSGAIGGALMVIGFFLLFGWQVGRYFQRNKPGLYDPAMLPPTLLPKG